MKGNLNLLPSVKDQIEKVVSVMKSWEENPRVQDHEKKKIEDNLKIFKHTGKRIDLSIAGVDGSGDFPSLSYSDSFVYVTVAQGVTFVSDIVSGLREQGPMTEPLIDITWIPEDAVQRRKSFDESFVRLAGAPIRKVIQQSDYRKLKAIISKKQQTLDKLDKELIRPHASDSGNIGIQLRSSAECGVAYRLITQDAAPDYVLIDTTFSLPTVSMGGGSLFYEHLKRLCCVEANKRNIAFFAVSKSHGLPSTEIIEEIARRKQGIEYPKVADHWYLRIPVPKIDNWTFGLAANLRLPPIGAITYLFRLHRTTQILRLDMDKEFWVKHIRGESNEQTEKNEQKIFQDLDYASHDQRSYGYPYPIKAGHDRASMTAAEKISMRKQITDAAIRSGMKPYLFRDASLATGHK